MAEADTSYTYGRLPGPAASGPRSLLSAGLRGRAFLLAGTSLTAFAAAELLTTFVSAIAGIAVHAVILTALIGAAGGGERRGGPLGDAASRLLYSLTLVPLIRILSLSMPLAEFEPSLWYLMAGLPVFVAALVIMGALGLRPGAIGLRLGWSPLHPAVALLGFALGYAEYQILHPEPLIDSLTAARFVVPALILMVGTGFLEEFVFRGLLQTAAAAVLGPATVLYVSTVFAILHIGYRSAPDVAFVLAIALIYGWVVRRTGSIMGVSVSHGITNIMLFLVVPFVPALSARPDWPAPF